MEGSRASHRRCFAPISELHQRCTEIVTKMCLSYSHSPSSTRPKACSSHQLNSASRRCALTVQAVVTANQMTHEHLRAQVRTPLGSRSGAKMSDDGVLLDAKWCANPRTDAWRSSRSATSTVPKRQAHLGPLLGYNCLARAKAQVLGCYTAISGIGVVVPSSLPSRSNNITIGTH